MGNIIELNLHQIKTVAGGGGVSTSDQECFEGCSCDDCKCYISNANQRKFGAAIMILGGIGLVVSMISYLISSK